MESINLDDHMNAIFTLYTRSRLYIVYRVGYLGGTSLLSLSCDIRRVIKSSINLDRRADGQGRDKTRSADWAWAWAG